MDDPNFTLSGYKRNLAYSAFLFQQRLVAQLLHNRRVSANFGERTFPDISANHREKSARIHVSDMADEHKPVAVVHAFRGASEQIFPFVVKIRFFSRKQCPPPFPKSTSVNFILMQNETADCESRHIFRAVQQFSNF